jgi:hypothetical protein
MASTYIAHVPPPIPKHNFFKDEAMKALATNIAFSMFIRVLK